MATLCGAPQSMLPACVLSSRESIQRDPRAAATGVPNAAAASHSLPRAGPSSARSRLCSGAAGGRGAPPDERLRGRRWALRSESGGSRQGCRQDWLVMGGQVHPTPPWIPCCPSRPAPTKVGWRPL
jgi:hypothetical protein